MSLISPEFTEQVSFFKGARPYLLAAVPLTCLGFMPLGMVALLCTLYALTVWSSFWTSSRLVGGLLIVCLAQWKVVQSLSALKGAQIAQVGLQFLLWVLAVLSLNLAAGWLIEGRRRGLWLVGAVGLLAPGPGVLLALVGGSLIAPGRGDLLSRGREQQQPRAWWALLGAVSLAILLSFALPQGGMSAFKPPGPSASAVAPSAASPVLTTPSASAAPSAPQVFKPPGRASWAGPPLSVLLGASTALLFSLLVMALQGRTSAGLERKRRAELSQYLLPLVLPLTAYLWYLSLGLWRGPQTTSPLGSAAEPALIDPIAPHQALVRKVLDSFPWLDGVPGLVAGGLWLAVLGMLALSYWLWSSLLRLGRTRQNSSPVEVASGRASAPADQALWLHRVRLAYQAAEAALSQAGLERGPAETPQQYAQRLGAAHPELARSLSILTTLYQPVRYGGEPSEQDAEAAEAASASCQQLLAGV